MFDWIRKRVGGKRNKNYSNMVKQAGKQSKAYTSNNIKSGSGKSSGKPKSSSRGSSSNAVVLEEEIPAHAHVRELHLLSEEELRGLEQRQ